MTSLSFPHIAKSLELSETDLMHLKKLQLSYLSDLILHRPLRYEADNQIRKLDERCMGEQVLLEGIIVKQINLSRKQLLLEVRNPNGHFYIRFFHFYPNQQRLYLPGLKIRAFGTLKPGYYGPEMIHPKISKDGNATESLYLTPVYPSIKRFTQDFLRKRIQKALKIADLTDYLPDYYIKKYRLPEFKTAITTLHAPTVDLYAKSDNSPTSPALRRLQLDELVAQQLSMALLKMARTQSLRPSVLLKDNLVKQFIASLPFSLTTAQQRVLQEIQEDLQHPYPMHRLLQGEVGSGKTVVAAIAALFMIEAGYQVALLAPTEILAEQHFSQFYEWLKPLGIHCALLISEQNKKLKEEIKLGLQKGKIPLVIGTHALIQPDVHFSHLRLIIVDEQHRFGVLQRLALKDKATEVDQLMLSATPIPRTLSMTYFADVEISLLNELPPNRIPIKTILINEKRRNEVEQFIRHQLHHKHQVYWVCPLIEESETLDLHNVMETYHLLTAHFPEWQVGLIHSRMSKADKAETMARFLANDIQLLVATTVIEVGINVPNASTMVIEHSERMGLSQLHQLRGRVGRSANLESECILLYQTPLSDKSKARLKVIHESNDGFRIAEEDLKLRGPGEFLGAKQSGIPLLRFASLVGDPELIIIAKEIAQYMLEVSPDLVEKHLARWLPERKSYLGV